MRVHTWVIEFDEDVPGGARAKLPEGDVIYGPRGSLVRIAKAVGAGDLNNDPDPDECDICEACGAVERSEGMTKDSEGVALCDECMDDLDDYDVEDEDEDDYAIDPSEDNDRSLGLEARP